MLQMNREQVETTVHENKCDDLSAMFNMIMDSKREEKGKMLIISLLGQVCLQKKVKICVTITSFICSSGVMVSMMTSSAVDCEFKPRFS